MRNTYPLSHSPLTANIFQSRQGIWFTADLDLVLTQITTWDDFQAA